LRTPSKQPVSAGAVARLVDVLIHDARNALSTAEANLTFVHESLPEAPEDVGDAIGDVVSSAHRVREALDDIALVARLHAGTIEPHRVRVGVRAVFESVARRLEHDARDRRVTLTYDAREPIAVDADAALFRRGLEIAMDAALARAQDGGVVLVRAQRGTIEVVTDGAALEAPPEALFDDAGAPRPALVNGGGATIRAFLLRAIVEAHGGTLKVTRSAVLLAFPASPSAGDE